MRLVCRRFCLMILRPHGKEAGPIRPRRREYPLIFQMRAAPQKPPRVMNGEVFLCKKRRKKGALPLLLHPVSYFRFSVTISPSSPSESTSFLSLIS